jgi:hypothetical protein
MNLNKIDAYRWEIPRSGEMRVPGVIYTSADMIDHVVREMGLNHGVRSMLWVPILRK